MSVIVCSGGCADFGYAAGADCRCRAAVLRFLGSWADGDFRRVAVWRRCWRRPPPPDRGRWGDLTQHRGPVTPHIDVSDRLTNVRDHHRDIDQDTTPVMKGHERASHQGLGELVGQTGPVTHHPEYDTPSVGHPAGPANGY